MASMDHFLMGLKYEKNEATKDMISKRVGQYMNRMEEIKKVLAQSGTTTPGAPQASSSLTWFFPLCARPRR